MYFFGVSFPQRIFTCVLNSPCSWFIMQSSEGRLLTTQKWSSMQYHCHHNEVKQAIFKIPRHLSLVLLSDPSLYELYVWTLINRWVDWLLILSWMRWQYDDVTLGRFPFLKFKNLKKSNNTNSSLPKFIFFWSHPENYSLLIFSFFFFVIDGQDGHECHMNEQMKGWRFELNLSLDFWSFLIELIPFVPRF